MNVKFLVVFLVVFLLFSGCAASSASINVPNSPVTPATTQTLRLPAPRLKSNNSLEESLHQRRSVREFSPAPLSLEEVSQLLWSAQGITSDDGGRTAPSAGGLYPLEIYLFAGKVVDLVPAIYKYSPSGHEIALINNQDLREALSQAALGQSPVKNGAIDIVFTAFFARTTPRYGDRGIRYVHMEAGHAAQNVCLQAAALDLAAVTIGAFEDTQVVSLLGLPEEETPLYIIPVGHKK
jgi:SagB-type dehydrogenase family enzyme